MALKFYAPVELADTSAGLTLDGDLVIDTTLLVADTTNGKIGIGTASPSQLFQVSASGTNPYIRVNEYAYTGLDIGQENGNGNGIINLRDSAALRIFTNATERMRISADGQVGIGETNVDARLHITSTSGSGIVNQKFESNGSAAWRLGIPASQTYFAFDNSADALTSPKMVISSAGDVGIGTTSPSAQLHVYSTGNGEIEVQRASGALFNIQAQSSLATIGTDSNHPLYLKTNSGTRVAITTGGNFGIGTTSPSTTLDVGDGQISGVDVLYGDSGGSLLLASYDKSSLASSYIGLYTANGTASGERMRITSGGNVLIGTTTDAGYKLRVNGSALFTNWVRVNGDDGIYFQDRGGGWRMTDTTWLRSYNDKSIYTGGGAYFGSNVGIGTTSPSANLHIAGGVTILGQNKIDGSSDNLKIMSDYAGVSGSSTIEFSVDNSEKMRITNGGDVGIGTTSPSGKLHIAPDANSNYVFTGTSTSGYTATFNIDDTGLDIGHNSASRALNLKTNSADRLTITGGGSVGIGTTSPSYKLDVNGTFRATTLYGDGSNLTGITATETDTLDSVTSRGSTTSNAIGVGGLNVDSGTLYVDSTNNRVGIGTTAPASTLMVHSTGTTAVSKQWQTIISDNNTLAADRGGGIIFRGRYSGTNPANFCGIRAGKLNSTNGDANAYLSLLYGAAGTMTEGVRINYNGNVLIGTTTDSGYKLEVDGDVNASGDYYAGGTQGYTGTVTIQQPSPNPPVNIDIQGGIITNVY